MAPPGDDKMQVKLRTPLLLEERVDFIVREFPGRLRDFRYSLRLAQWKLARLIGTQETTIYRLERGENLPQFRTLAAINLLGWQHDIRPAFFSDGHEGRPVSSKPDLPTSSHDWQIEVETEFEAQPLSEERPK